MKKLAYISMFLMTLLLSSVVISTISSIKNYMDMMELTEESSESNSNNGVEEEEEQAVFITKQEMEIPRQHVLFTHYDTKLCYTVLDVLTRPPRG